MYKYSCVQFLGHESNFIAFSMFVSFTTRNVSHVIADILTIFSLTKFHSPSSNSKPLNQMPKNIFCTVPSYGFTFHNSFTSKKVTYFCRSIIMHHRRTWNLSVTALQVRSFGMLWLWLQEIKNYGVKFSTNGHVITSHTHPPTHKAWWLEKEQFFAF